MRLKVSSKVAVQTVDALVREGTEMRRRLHLMFEAMEKGIEKEHEDYEKAREEKRQKAINAAQSLPDDIELAMPNGKKISIPNPAKPLNQLAVAMASFPDPSLLGGSDFVSKVGEQGMKELREQFADWRDRTRTALEDIFMDFTPVHTFMDARGERYSQPFPMGERRTEEYINITRQLDAKVAVLIGFYKTLSENIRSPLFYLPDKAQLCFYDLVCPLTADTNEASLCKFMFGFGIGEKVEMEDVYAHITGHPVDTYGAEGKSTVKNAVDGLNRKTKASFGFPIVKRDGATLSISLPSRVISALA